MRSPSSRIRFWSVNRMTRSLEVFPVRAVLRAHTSHTRREAMTRGIRSRSCASYRARPFTCDRAVFSPSVSVVSFRSKLLISTSTGSVSAAACAVPSMRFCAPSACQIEQVHRGSRRPSRTFRRMLVRAVQFASPDTVPSSGFLTLSTVCSLLDRADLMNLHTRLASAIQPHVDSTRGVSSLRSFPPEPQSKRLSTSAPLMLLIRGLFHRASSSQSNGVPGREPKSPPCESATRSS